MGVCGCPHASTCAPVCQESINSHIQYLLLNVGLCVDLYVCLLGYVCACSMRMCVWYKYAGGVYIHVCICVCGMNGVWYVHICVWRSTCSWTLVWPVNHICASHVQQPSSDLGVLCGPGVWAEVSLCPAGGAPGHVDPLTDSRGCPPRPARARPAAPGYKFAPRGWPAAPHWWSSPECPATSELSPLAWPWPRVSAWAAGR